jgi:hypothetical protein
MEIPGAFHLSRGEWQVDRVKVKPVPKPEDRLFMPLYPEGNASIKGKETKLKNAYHRTAATFRNAIDRLGIGYEENGERRKVTLHTLRRFAFTTCSRVNGESYAKYHIGRKVHEYDKRTPEQIAEDFSKVEPILTLLDSSGVELQQAALENQIVALQKQLQEKHGNDEMSIRRIVEEVVERYARRREKLEEKHASMTPEEWEKETEELEKLNPLDKLGIDRNTAKWMA